MAELLSCDVGTDVGAELGQIATEWSLVFDPIEFVERYARAIKKYLLALVKRRDDAEEVAQDFFLWVTKNGFPRARKERGRFRDYLKVAVRNYALNYLRRKRLATLDDTRLAQIPAHDDPAHLHEREWLAEWRACLLNRAWLRLERHQERSQNHIYYTALRVTANHPECDSTTLAGRASVIVGRPIRPDAFRKQLSRGRRLFCELLVKEIAQTLDSPTATQIEEELVDLGLIGYMRAFLPAGLRTDSAQDPCKLTTAI